MSKVIIYHNQHCTSSRNAVVAATEAGVDFDEVRYMKNPLDDSGLRDIIAKLEDPVENLVRKDSQFKKLGLNPDDYVGNPDAVVEVLIRYPRLMQRPLLVCSGIAIIGRPLGKVKAKDRLAGFWSECAKSVS